MTDELNLAQEASEEVVQTEVEEAEAPEVVESTEGQDESQPAEADDAADKAADAEEKTETITRRERRKANRKAKQEESRQREAAAVKEAEEAKAQLESIKEAASAIPRPKQSEFTDFDEYQAALSAYKMSQIIDGREQQRLEATAKAHFEKVEAVKVTKQQEDAQNWAAQQVDGREKYTDFDAVVQNAPINQPMAEMIVGSDVGEDVAYFLGKNHDVANQIAALTSPIEIARAMGRLEAQVSAPQAKTTTTAPAPINPVKGSGTPSADPEKMTPDQYRTWRQNGGKF